MPGDACSGPGLGGECAASQTVGCVPTDGCDTCLWAGLPSNAESSDVASGEVLFSVSAASSGISFAHRKNGMGTCARRSVDP